MRGLVYVLRLYFLSIPNCTLRSAPFFMGISILKLKFTLPIEVLTAHNSSVQLICIEAWKLAQPTAFSKLFPFLPGASRAQSFSQALNTPESTGA